MRLKEITLTPGATYVTDMKYTNPFSKNIRLDDPHFWYVCIVMDDKAHRFPFSEKEGVPCAVSLWAPTKEARELLTSRRLKVGEWEFRIVPPKEIKQTYKSWVADTKAGYKEACRIQKATIKKNLARIKAEAKANAAEAAERATQGEREVTLRTLLANYGINDSDGWRAVNTKTRWSDEADRQTLTTYVRHLDLDDVLRLTGGLTEPAAATKAKRITKSDGKGTR